MRNERKSTHIENEQRVLRAHDLRWAVRGNLLGFLMPPKVPSLSPRNLPTSPLQNKDLLHNPISTLKSRINNSFSSNSLATTTTFVSRDQHTRLAILDTITERFGRETGENDRVNCTDAGAGEESSDGVPCHRKVNGDGVTLADPEGAENIGDTADLTEEITIANEFALTRLICLVDNSGLSEENF